MTTEDKEYLAQLKKCSLRQHEAWLIARLEAEAAEVEQWKGWSEGKGRVLQEALGEAVHRAEAAEATAERERERAEQAETAFDNLSTRHAERLAQIEALETLVRSFCEALRDWPASTNAAQLVRLAADADALLATAPASGEEESRG